jgi:hypothetical protein
MTLTERKGSFGASVLEHATKVITLKAKAHERKTRPSASENGKGMADPMNK